MPDTDRTKKNEQAMNQDAGGGSNRKYQVTDDF